MSATLRVTLRGRCPGETGMARMLDIEYGDSGENVKLTARNPNGTSGWSVLVPLKDLLATLKGDGEFDLSNLCTSEMI